MKTILRSLVVIASLALTACGRDDSGDSEPVDMRSNVEVADLFCKAVADYEGITQTEEGIKRCRYITICMLKTCGHDELLWEAKDAGACLGSITQKVADECAALNP
jgi:hypothetical protein